MTIIEEAFTRLYPDKDFRYDAKIKYSNHFKDYNANVKLYGNNLEFGLSRKWKSVSQEIRIGLLKELMLNLFGGKKITMNIDLYNKFIKNLHISINKSISDPILEASFERVNNIYFNGLIEQPNLIFGKSSRSSLASYEYSTDTINFSIILKKDLDVLDYVMYHELLHKKLKFKHKNGKSFHHTAEFKKSEKQFENQKEMEQRLKRLTSWRFC
ncbi:hypothetical protein A3K72_01695 [Candidatus Woesearchaeota archaeon RBG_13_36_6]|nr:MAG: hypothetical protein A3K72_01695 [Candidatus Woesearchaeota archaeon RBG_13_36_6]